MARRRRWRIRSSSSGNAPLRDCSNRVLIGEISLREACFEAQMSRGHGLLPSPLHVKCHLRAHVHLGGKELQRHLEDDRRSASLSRLRVDVRGFKRILRGFKAFNESIEEDLRGFRAFDSGVPCVPELQHATGLVPQGGRDLEPAHLVLAARRLLKTHLLEPFRQFLR